PEPVNSRSKRNCSPESPRMARAVGLGRKTRAVQQYRPRPIAARARAHLAQNRSAPRIPISRELPGALPRGCPRPKAPSLHANRGGRTARRRPPGGTALPRDPPATAAIELTALRLPRCEQKRSTGTESLCPGRLDLRRKHVKHRGIVHPRCLYRSSDLPSAPSRVRNRRLRVQQVYDDAGRVGAK